MNDEQLLRMAAKAADVNVSNMSYLESGYLYGESRSFSPLTDSGDALWLAVKLEIDISFRVDISLNQSVQCVRANERMEPFAQSPDPYAATRRAIVRAAAEIGRTMK